MRLFFLLLSKRVIFPNFRVEFTQKSFMRLVRFGVTFGRQGTSRHEEKCELTPNDNFCLWPILKILHGCNLPNST